MLLVLLASDSDFPQFLFVVCESGCSQPSRASRTVGQHTLLIRARTAKKERGGKSKKQNDNVLFEPADSNGTFCRDRSAQLCLSGHGQQITQSQDARVHLTVSA